MDLYNNYLEHAQKIADIEHSISILNWDQEVFMPENSAPKELNK